MAEVKLNRILAAVVLLVGATLFLCGQILAAQSANGSLSGRLTDPHSRPLAGVLVLARHQLTGAEFRATTAHNGAYRFDPLPAGLYTLQADSPALGHGSLENILVQPGYEARIQTAIFFEPPVPLAPHAPEPELAHQPPPAAGQPRLAAALPPHTPAEISSAAAAALPPSFERPAAAAARPDATDPSRQSASPLLPSATAAQTLLEPEMPALQPTHPFRRKNLRRLNHLPAVAPQPEFAQAETGELCIAQTAPPQPASAPSKPAAPSAEQLAARHELERPRRDLQDPRETTAQAPDPAASIVSTALSGNEIHALPSSGRNWEEFTLDTPESTAVTGDRTPLRGPGASDADASIDGVSRRLAFGSIPTQGRNTADQPEGSPDGASSPWSAGHGLAISEAAVDTLKSSASNSEADASRAAGGETRLTTLRGTDQFHGQFFLHSRASLWGARNPDTKWLRETAVGSATALPTFSALPYSPSEQELVWGFGLGRQLRRNRLFWFAALDSNHRNNPAIAIARNPVDFFSPPTSDRLQLLGAQLSSASLAIPSYTRILETLAGLMGPVPRTYAQWSGFARLDGSLAERHRLTFELNASSSDSPSGGFTRSSAAYGTHSFGFTHASEQWALTRWEAFLTPNLLATTQASFGRTLLGTHAQAPSTYEKTLDINVWDQLPQIVIDSSDGITIGNPANFGPGDYPDERSLHLQHSLSWAHDNLIVKAGFQFDRFVDHTGLLRNQTGTYHYANLENFATDALAFATYGISGTLNKFDQHNCDQTGRAWRDSSGSLRGLGYLPCYSYYTQTMGPTNWFVKTNELAAYATAQWQPAKFAVFSAGLRWERELLPPPIDAVANFHLPRTQQIPSPGNNWGPRLSFAIGGQKSHWPVLRLAYGLYYSRISNSALQTVLSHTGSANGNLSFYLRPTDNLTTGGAPPFPYVFAGEPLSVVKPGAVELAPTFRNPEVHQALAGIDSLLPRHLEIEAAAALSLGRRLPVTVDTNFDPSVNPGTLTYTVSDTSGKGPIKASKITVPLYATWPSATSSTGTAGRLYSGYQQIVEMMSRANSTYEAAMIRINRYGGRNGLTLHAHYTYSHAMDWNPNESLRLTGGSVLDPADFGLEYGVGNLDARHAASLQAIYDLPWKLHGRAARFANQWTLSGTGHYRSGLPYTMHTGSELPKKFTTSGAAIIGLGYSMNGSGGDNRVYGTGNDGIVYNVGRNTYRYPATWKADLRIAKRIDLDRKRSLNLFLETFNLFNHRNITSLSSIGYTLTSGTLTGTPPVLTYRGGSSTSTAFGQPINVNASDSYRERQIQFGLRMSF